MSKVEELRVKTIDLMSDPNMSVSLEYATELISALIAAAKEDESAKIVHCGECVYAAWESQEPCGKGEGIACHVVAGRSRPWLGSATDYCSEGRRTAAQWAKRKVKP